MLEKAQEDDLAALQLVTYSTRVSASDARRVMAIAAIREWSVSKTIQKLITAALDAKLIK